MSVISPLESDVEQRVRASLARQDCSTPSTGGSRSLVPENCTSKHPLMNVLPSRMVSYTRALLPC